MLVENLPELHLDLIKNKTELNNLMNFLENGMGRMDQFCDFDDSKYHNKTRLGRCENDTHSENTNSSDYLNEMEEDDFHFIINEGKGLSAAFEKYEDKLNPETTLRPVYDSNEMTAKYVDEPTWICPTCYDSNSDNYDGDGIAINCDMDLGT